MWGVSWRGEADFLVASFEGGAGFTAVTGAVIVAVFTAVGSTLASLDDTEVAIDAIADGDRAYFGGFAGFGFVEADTELGVVEGDALGEGVGADLGPKARVTEAKTLGAIASGGTHQIVFAGFARVAVPPNG